MISLEEYIKSRHTPETAKTYLREIGIFLDHNPAARTAVYSDLVSYLALLRTRYSNPAYICTKLCSIKKYYQYLVYVGIRQDNPAMAIRLRDKTHKDIQLQDLFSAGELELLMEYQGRYREIRYKNRVLISLLIYQGLTAKEILQLETGNVDMDKGTVYIKPTIKSNGRQLKLKTGQIIQMYRYIHDERPLLLKRGKKTTDILLLGKTGKPLTCDGINYLVSTFKKLFPERVLNPKTIRMSVIANLLKELNDIRQVQLFAGHKYPGTTERYKQNEIESLMAEINRHHPLK